MPTPTMPWKPAVCLGMPWCPWLNLWIRDMRSIMPASILGMSAGEWVSGEEVRGTKGKGTNRASTMKPTLRGVRKWVLVVLPKVHSERA
jgi:hypothetical protein